MKSKICIIGVEDSIELVKLISEEFHNAAEFVFYSYTKVSDILTFIKRTSDIDIIMFTGRYPYNYFKRNTLIDIPYFAVSKSNETLIEAFWRIRNENLDFTRVSIDRSPESQIIKMLEILEIPTKEIQLIGDSSKVDLDEIYHFHKNNCDKGKTEAIISSNYKVYCRLIQEGYKAYRVLPSRVLLRESIKRAIAIAGTEKIKSTQVAVQIIRINDSKEDKITKYNQLKLLNRFDSILIDYTHEIEGTYLKFGHNEYMIFTTRGFIGIGDVESKIGMLVEQSEKLEISFSTGIGYGNSIMRSEKNSRIALKHAMKEEKSGCYIVDDDSTLTGPFFGMNSYNLSYRLVSVDEKLAKISKKTGVSEKYLSMIKAIVSQRGDNKFSAEDLAEFLNLSQRSALRILNKLEAGSVAENVGKSSDNTKGRPKKIYQMNL
ncbi:transcriptional regulator [Gottschalkiaceae bacterium SANA]|nr:transcriptional regulator [Gottschalkiaceae bacterium SANA]